MIIEKIGKNPEFDQNPEALFEEIARRAKADFLRDLEENDGRKIVVEHHRNVNDGRNFWSGRYEYGPGARNECTSCCLFEENGQRVYEYNGSRYYCTLSLIRNIEKLEILVNNEGVGGATRFSKDVSIKLGIYWGILKSKLYENYSPNCATIEQLKQLRGIFPVWMFDRTHYNVDMQTVNIEEINIKLQQLVENDPDIVNKVFDIQNNSSSKHHETISDLLSVLKENPQISEEDAKLLDIMWKKFLPTKPVWRGSMDMQNGEISGLVVGNNRIYVIENPTQEAGRATPKTESRDDEEPDLSREELEKMPLEKLAEILSGLITMNKDSEAVLKKIYIAGISAKIQEGKELDAKTNNATSQKKENKI